MTGQAPEPGSGSGGPSAWLSWGPPRVYLHCSLSSGFASSGWSGGAQAQGSGLRAQGSGLRAQGSGLRAQGLGLRAQGIWHRPGRMSLTGTCACTPCCTATSLLQPRSLAVAVRQYVGMPVHRYVVTSVRRYAGTSVRRYVGTSVGRYIGMWG